MSFWTAFGAIGQWLCAIATFIAVLVALKPYKRKLKVRLVSITITVGAGEEVVPLSVLVKNTGQKPIAITGVGIAEKQYEILFWEGISELAEECQDSLPVSTKTLWNCFLNEDIKQFRVFVCDANGNYYYSPKYKKSAFRENTEISELFK